MVCVPQPPDEAERRRHICLRYRQIGKYPPITMSKKLKPLNERRAELLKNDVLPVGPHAMLALPVIQNTRRYLDRLEQHICAVADVWETAQERWAEFEVMRDDARWLALDIDIRRHDLSKLSAEELTQYRRHFYATAAEEVGGPYSTAAGQAAVDFLEAVRHHQRTNDHHWECWLARYRRQPHEAESRIVHMVVDWIAFERNEGACDALTYFEKNKERMNLPAFAELYITALLGAWEQGARNEDAADD